MSELFYCILLILFPISINKYYVLCSKVYWCLLVFIVVRRDALWHHHSHWQTNYLLAETLHPTPHLDDYLVLQKIAVITGKEMSIILGHIETIYH